MAKRKFLFIAAAPLLLLLGMMLSFRILSRLPESESEPISSQPAPIMVPADAATQKALEFAVQGQLSAITKGDYVGALTFSAPQFRGTIDPKQFQEMIETRFKEMTEVKKEDFEIGQVAEKVANVSVVVTTIDNIRMGYMYNLVREEDKWYIMACSPGFPVGSVSESIKKDLPPQRGMKPHPPITPKL